MEKRWNSKNKKQWWNETWKIMKGKEIKHWENRKIMIEKNKFKNMGKIRVEKYDKN